MHKGLWLWLCLAGISLGELLWKRSVEIDADIPPSGWARERTPVPYKQSSLQGSLPIHAGQWRLDFYQAIYPIATQTNPNAAVSLSAELPEHGRLEIWYSSPPLRARMGDRWMDICQTRNQDPRCVGTDDTGVALIIHRGKTDADSRIVLYSENSKETQTIACTIPVPNWDATNRYTLQKVANGLDVQINDQHVTCNVSIGNRIPMIRPGLREVHISDVTWNGMVSTTNSPIMHWIYIFMSVGGCGLMGWLYRQKSPFLSAILTAPLMLGWLYQNIDGRVLVEDMRASWLSPYDIPVLLCVLPAVFLQLCTLSLVEWNKNPRVQLLIFAGILFSLAITFWYSGVFAGVSLLGVYAIAYTFVLRYKNTDAFHIPAVWIIVCSSLYATCTPFHWAGNFWTGIATMSIGLLFFSNKYLIRGFNWWSVLFCTLVVIGSENSLRATKAGTQWSTQGSNTMENEIFGWIRQANESFALFEEGKHTKYPDKGFPVAIPQSDKKLRVVSFGGSTTGGAFQNDDLQEFYPALITKNIDSPLLRNQITVLNQGVGGWTTWHIAKYFHEKKEELAPDLITLYVGHNDILTSIPIPYKELYPLWQQNRSNKEIGSWLQQFRLYQALRYTIVSLKSANNKVAVPMEDAEENLVSVIADAGDIPIILISEGLSPDPDILFPYNDMMQRIANTYANVYYIPVAETIASYPPHSIFLDDCHLTAYGHNIVADMIAQKIEEILQK